MVCSVYPGASASGHTPHREGRESALCSFRLLSAWPAFAHHCSTHPWPSQALRPSTDCTGSVLSCQPQDSHYRLTWRRSAYCFCTSGIEEVTFRSASRSFFRLALASEWMISKLILKGAKRQDGWDPRDPWASAGKRSQRALDRTVPDTTQASSHTPLRALGPTNFPHCRFQESVSPEGALYA